MNNFQLTVFILVNLVFSITNANDCPLLDIAPFNENLETAACSDCRCLNNSFPQLISTQTRERHLSSLQIQLQERFMSKSVPSFVQQFSEFSSRSPRCSLDQLQNTECQQARIAAQSVIDNVLNISPQISCFSDRTIERISLRAKRTGEILNLFNMVGEAANANTLSDYALLFARSRGLQNRFQDYNDLVTYLNNPSQLNEFSEFVGDQCQRFYQDLNDLFCKPVESFPTHSPQVQEYFFDVNVAPNETANSLESSELEIFALTCQQRQICASREDQCIGIEPLHDQFYQRRPELVERVTMDSTESWIAQLEHYCPLLNCQNIESAFGVMHDEGTCEPMDPPRTLAEVSEYLGCQSDNQDDLCSENLFARILNEYQPLQDEPLSIASHSFTEADLSTPVMREHLVSLGHDADYVESLGELGIARVFGMPVNIEVREIEQAQPIDDFISLGADDASQAIAQRESQVRAIQETIASETRETLSNTPRRNRPRRANAVVAENRSLRANPSTINEGDDTLSDSELRSSLVSGFNEAVQAARDAIGTSSRTLDRARENLTNPVAEPGPIAAQPPVGTRTRGEAQAVRPSTRPAQVARPDQGISPSIANDAAIAPPDQVRPQEWYQPSEQNPAVSEVLPDAVTPGGGGSISDDAAFASDAIRPQAMGGGRGSNSRSPASESDMATADRYVERTRDELPLLTLNDLDSIDLQKPFILGLRDGASLMRIEFIPVDYHGEIRYRVASHQRNEISPVVLRTLMTSPFFQRYLHPDLLRSAGVSSTSDRPRV
jgi:hypothetical protein